MGFPTKNDHFGVFWGTTIWGNTHIFISGVINTVPLVPARLAPHKHLVYNLSSKSWYSGQQKYIASLLCIENSCLVLKNRLKVDHHGFDVNVSSFPPWEGFSKLRENQQVQLQQTMVNLQYEINTLLETNNLPLKIWDVWKTIRCPFLGQQAGLVWERHGC